MTFEIHAEISGNNAKLETRLIGDYTAAELKTLDKLLDYAIIKPTDSETRKKDNWVKGDRGLFAGSVPVNGGRMTRKEYNRVSSEIFTNKPLLKKGAEGYHYYGNHLYRFTVIEPGTYKFIMKIKI